MEAVENVIRNPENESLSVKGRVNLWGRIGDAKLKVTVMKKVEHIVVVTVIYRR